MEQQLREQPTTNKRVKKKTSTAPELRKPKLSKLFQEMEVDPSPETIMEKCPPEINAKEISLNPRSYANRRKMLKKYADKGKKYKWWNEDDKIEAASVYALTGSAARAGEITGIPAVTIRQWKTQEWWPQVIDRIRQEKDDELDVKLTKIIDKSVEAINERLDNGDYFYNNMTGEVTRKPLGGKEMSVMTSIFVDKRELIRKKKEIKTEQSTVNDRLKKLADEFTKFVKMRTIEGESKEVIEESTDLSDITDQSEDTGVTTPEITEVLVVPN